MPVGFLWPAWTIGSEVLWGASIVAGTPFGIRTISIFFGLSNCLMDAYTIDAASVFADRGIPRSLFDAAFPI